MEDDKIWENPSAKGQDDVNKWLNKFGVIIAQKSSNRIQHPIYHLQTVTNGSIIVRFFFQMKIFTRMHKYGEARSEEVNT